METLLNQFEILLANRDLNRAPRTLELLQEAYLTAIRELNINPVDELKHPSEYSTES